MADFKYRFVTADGRSCCASDDPRNLCDHCKAALAASDQLDPYAAPLAALRAKLPTRTNATAYTSIERMASFRTAILDDLSRSLIAAHQPSRSDAHRNPPDGYQLALAARR